MITSSPHVVPGFSYHFRRSARSSSFRERLKNEK